MSAQSAVSISKLKSELRQAQRLLAKQGDKLNATLKVDTERRVESLKSQIDEEQQRRGIDSTVTGSNKPTSTSNLDPEPRSSNYDNADFAEQPKSKSKKDKSKKEDKYKMLRHVEHVKTLRKVKQAERNRTTLQTELQNVPADDSKDSRRKLKSLEKELKTAAQQLDIAKRDAWYTVVSYYSVILGVLCFQLFHKRTESDTPPYCVDVHCTDSSCRHFRFNSNTLPYTRLALS